MANTAYRRIGLGLLAGNLAFAGAPLFRVVDLNVGETAKVEVAGGKAATVKLLATGETRDRVRSAVRSAQAEVEVNGARTRLSCGNYQLPVAVGGVQVDCAVTRAYYSNTNADHWALAKDARLRLWPAGGPLMPPGAMVYPVRQRWFAGRTQMANEPTYVDGGESFGERRIYYHAGLDIGGAEGLTEVVAAMGGTVASAGREVLDQYRTGGPVRARYDRVYVLDDSGWMELYAHLQAIDPAVRPGSRVSLGQKIGVLGKEGDSGGWSHLHFEILALQPSGRWGTLEGYGLLWEAYQRQYRPDLIAVARPHVAALTGETVVLDAARSWSRAPGAVRYEWTFSDGATAAGARVERTYARPGVYSEILKITDARGRTAWDFATVDVLDPAHRDQAPPSIHAACWPTMGIRPGAPVTFKVRTFGTQAGEETWDFGDGSAKVTTRSDGNAVALAKDGYAATTHAFAKPGDYIVRVERERAVAHLHVRVDAAGRPR